MDKQELKTEALKEINRFIDFLTVEDHEKVKVDENSSAEDLILALAFGLAKKFGWHDTIVRHLYSKSLTPPEGE